MSRPPSRENIAAFCSENLSHLADISNMTISDPNRLKIPFGSKGKLSGRQQVSWPVVGPPEEDKKAPILKSGQTLQKQSSQTEVVLEISNPSEQQTEVSGWCIPVGYAVFGMALALCNLLTLTWSRLVCSALSPLPMACLIGQALSFDSRYAIFVVLCAWLIPLECAVWNPYAVIPFCIVLACAIVLAVQRRGPLVWMSFVGLTLSLGLALPIPALGLDPRWGVTLLIFFLCLLCTVTSLAPRMTYKIKYI